MTTGPEELSLNYLLDPAFQLVNTAGRPLTNGWIEVYYHGTRDKYYCASDFDGTLHPFKIPLDSLGSNIVLADPNFSYDIYVYNSFGSLQMSRYNVNPGSGSGGGSSGEGGPAEHWSSDTAGGASTTVIGGTTVYLTLPSSEDEPEFVDHTTDTAIFLKEGLYHIDAVVSFKQDEDDLQNIIKDIVVNTGLMGWDAQMTGQKNWTGPESTDDDRHFLELHTVVSVPEDLLQTIYFQIASPVDLDSAAIEKLDIVKLTAGGNGIKYTGGYGIDVTGQVISVTGMMPESSASNFVDNSTYQVDIQNIYETIAETSAMIPSGVATEDWVMEQGFITSADLPESVPLVAGEGISIVDTSAATIISCSGAGVSEEWVENYTSAFITANVLDDYVTDNEFNDVVNSLSDDISAVSGAIPSLEGYATQNWVEDYTSAFITSADIPDVPEDLVTSAELASVSGDIVSQIPSLDGYATEQFVEDYTSAYITSGDVPVYTAGDHIDITNHEISVNGVSGVLAGEGISITASGGNYYINNLGIVPVDVVTSGELATVSGEIVNQIPSLDGYATEEYVQDNTSAFITEDALDGYATQQWVGQQGYLTSIPAEYATSGDLATVSGELSSVSTYARGSFGPYFPTETNYQHLRFNYGSTGTPETLGVRRIVEVSNGSTYTTLGELVPVPPTSGLVLTSLTSSGMSWKEPSGGGSEVDIIPSLQTGTKIADYVIDGTSGELYAPAGGGATYYAGDHIVIDQNNYISTSGLMEESSAFMIDSAGYANRVTDGGAGGTLNLGTISGSEALQVIGLQDGVEYTLNCSGNTDGVQIYQGQQWDFGNATRKYPTNNEIKFTKSDFDNISYTGNYYLHFTNPYSGLIGNNATLSYDGSGITNTRYALVDQLPTSGQLIPAGGSSGQVVTNSSSGPVWSTPFKGVYSSPISTTPNSVEVVTSLPVSPVAGRIYLIPES